LPAWDVFHADRLEVERNLTDGQVRNALARGEVCEDDLVRPAGTAIPWARIVDLPGFLDDLEPPPPTVAEPPPTVAEPDVAPPAIEPEEERLTALIDDDDDDFEAGPSYDLSRLGRALDAFDSMPTQSIVSGPVDETTAPIPSLMDGDEEDDDEEAEGEFTLSRAGAETVEELDLAAMVDVAFQLVLFFLVTATTVLYKSLEVPKPSRDAPAGAVAQGQPKRTLDDLKESYILVEIDPAGAVKVDHEPAPAEMKALAERLRAARTSSGRTAMLLSADFSTPHRSAVAAFDAANEIGLRISVAKPAGKGGG